MAEIKKYEAPSEEQKPKEDNKTSKQLDTEIDKKDGNNSAAGINLMATAKIKEAQKEIDTLGLSSDELKNRDYTGQFTKAQSDFTTETKAIIEKSKATPEEKTKALELAFEQFQEKIGGIKGTNEGKDAKIAKENSERMKERDKKNEQGSQDFKEALLKSIQGVTEGKIQAQKLAAKKEGNTEQQNSKAQAEKSQGSTGDVTLAFGPPGNLEKLAQA